MGFFASSCDNWCSDQGCSAGVAHGPLHVLMGESEMESGKDLKGKKVEWICFAGTMEYLSRVAVKPFWTRS